MRRAAVAGGALGILLTVVGALIDPDQFFRSYLVAFVYWLGVGSGCLGILMVYHLTGGAWGVSVRRILEAGTATLPAMAILFIPLAFGLHHLYEWTHTEAVMADAVLSKKVAYLNVPFFLVRAVIYFVVWLGLAHLLYTWSGRQDRTGDPALEARMRKLSGIGIVLWGFAVTFAAFDWLMSLEPHWFSTIFGMLIIVGQGLNGLAFVLVVANLLSTREPFGRVLLPTVLNDLGNLLLTFVMLWAYLSFSQLLIIWSGNLPEEIPWYLHRIAGGWRYVAMALGLFHFAVPFLVLLGRGNKRQLPRLAMIAAGVMVIRFVDIFFLVAPTFSKGGFAFHWMDLTALAGVGGIWLLVFLWRLPQRPLLAPNDPELEPALAREY